VASWQLDPAGTGPRQVDALIRKSPGSSPVNDRPVTVSGPLPLFVSAIVCGDPIEPCVTVPRVSVDGLTDATAVSGVIVIPAAAAVATALVAAVAAGVT
jgi:hypothetical protein